jgi:hypothetical protein
MIDRLTPEQVIANFLDFWFGDELKPEGKARSKLVDGTASLIDTELFKHGYVIVDKKTGKEHTGSTGLEYPILGEKRK